MTNFFLKIFAWLGISVSLFWILKLVFYFILKQFEPSENEAIQFYYISIPSVFISAILAFLIVKKLDTEDLQDIDID